MDVNYPDKASNLFYGGRPFVSLCPLCLLALAEKWERGRAGCSFKTNSPGATCGRYTRLAAPCLRARGWGMEAGLVFLSEESLTRRRGACAAWEAHVESV